tara:strand:- start:17330 stop:17761 length:432 start_codon:yes stop_codon:yes gene_type:complete
MGMTIQFKTALGAAMCLALAGGPVALARADDFPSPSGQAYETYYGALTSATLAIEFGEGDSGGTVTITAINPSPAPPPAGLEFGTLGQWSQAADGSVTISGSLFFLPDGGPATCQSWEADYSGQEETCWFNDNGVTYAPLRRR